MLTPYQLQIAHIVGGIAGPEGFALAGGGAMIAQGLVDRPTKDLDYFATIPERVKPTSAQVKQALEETGFDVTTLIETDGFVRLEVRRQGEVCEIDLGQDARRWPTIEAPGVGTTLAIEELAADKTLALFGRAAPRDFVDVHALALLLGEDRLCELAADKDPGFRRTYMAEALGKIYRLDIDQFGIGGDRLSELRRWADRWRDQLMEQARRLEPDLAPERSRDLGPDLGL